MDLSGAKDFTKSVRFGAKSAFAGADVTPEMLAKINGYALAEIAAEDVYARKFILAHNGVDRDGERFSEAMLEDFARTLPGKSFLKAHDRRQGLPLGLYFDATTEEMTAEQFKALTGEDPRLPEGTDTVKVLWAWVYLMKQAASSQDMIINLDGGIYRHVSIGFSAADLAPVKGAYDQILFWEYQAPGEATEGSLVWLGAQQGATAQKAYKAEKTTTGGVETMKILIAKIGELLGKSFGQDASEESVAAAVKTALDEKGTEISRLTQEVTVLKPLAEAGKAYQEELVGEYVRMKAALGECEETPEAQEKLKGFAVAMGTDFLRNETKTLRVRMDEKFPDGHQLDGDDRRDKSKSGKTAAGEKGAPEDNPLIPKE